MGEVASLWGITLSCRRSLLKGFTKGFNFIIITKLFILRVTTFVWSSHWEHYGKLNTVEALVSDHLGNSEKWSQLELVAYKNGLL